jgi:hypothetical protein
MRLFRCSLFEASLCLRRHTCGRFRRLRLCGCKEYLPSEYLPRWQRTAVGSSGRVATLQWIRWGYSTIGLPTRHVVCLFGQMVALAWTMLVVALHCRDMFRYHYQRDHVVETASKAKPSGIVQLLGSIKILVVKASVEVGGISNSRRVQTSSFVPLLVPCHASRRRPDPFLSIAHQKTPRGLVCQASAPCYHCQ